MWLCMDVLVQHKSSSRVAPLQVYQDFTAKVTGLEDRRKRIKDAKELNKVCETLSAFIRLEPPFPFF